MQAWQMRETGLADEGGLIGSRAIQDWRVKGSGWEWLGKRPFTCNILKVNRLEVKGGF